MGTKVSRREFLRVSVLGAAGVAAAACATATPEVVEKEVTTVVEKERVVTQVVKEVVQETVVVEGTPKVIEKVVEKVVTPTPAPMTYHQSPMLSGLPPLEERLPKSPLVIEAPGGDIGTYGGNMSAYHWGVGEHTGVQMQFKYDRLVRLSSLYGPNREYVYEPMIADWWEMSDDTREFTFHISEGTKWSDGVPLTTEDLRFYWEDLMLYENVAAILGIQVFEGEIEVIDDFTFKIVFPTPRGTFLFDQGSSNRPQPKWMEFPAHYLKQFHPEHVSAIDLETTVKEHNFDTWDQLMAIRTDWLLNPDLPQLSMWVMDRDPDESGFTFWMRNPYLGEVDVEGNQLPYIDYVTGLAYEREIGVMKVIQGEVDYSYRYLRVVNYPALKQGEFKGHYTTGREVNPKPTQLNLMMNQTTNDEVLRSLFQDIRFRKAVSHAINRQEIVDVVWNGLGEGSGVTAGSYVAYGKPEHKDMYAEYDVDLANQLLDEMGLEWDANHEFRLRPDGETLEVIYSTPGYFGGNVDAHQLFVEYVAAIGIKVIWRTATGDAHNEWASSSESQWVDNSIAFDEGRHSFVPSGGRNWGNQWGVWLTSEGKEGIEPPEPMKEIYALAMKGEEANTTKERMEAWGEALDIMVREIYVIGIAGHDVRPSTCHERLRNFRQDLQMQGVNPQVAVYPSNFCAPETWYLDLDWTP